MTPERIAVPPSGSVTVRVTAGSAAVTVEALDIDHVDVETERGEIEVIEPSLDDARTHVQVSTRSSSVTVRCPEGTDVVLAVGSGTASVRGRAGAVKATTRSGSVRIEAAESLDARTGSGTITVGECDAECRVMTRSGKIDVGAVGRLHAATKSGRIKVRAADEVDVHAGSGKLTLGVTGRGRVRIRSMSGASKLTVAGDGRPSVAFRTVGGRLRNDVGEGDDFDLDVRTVSGSVSVVRGG